METYNISGLVQRRLAEASFHIVSEDYVRIEFRNLVGGDRLALPAFSGNTILTCYRGSFQLRNAYSVIHLQRMDQCVMEANVPVELDCSEDGTIQFIWTPPFGRSQT